MIEIKKLQYNSTATDKPIFHDYKFDRSKYYDKPPIAIELNNETFGTLGNFSMVIGKAKTKKSFLMASLTAAATGDEAINLFRGCLPPDKKRVIYFDTEQGDYHVWLLDQRISRLKDIESNSFDIFALRSATTIKRLKVIEEVVKEYEDIGLIIIDGIRDVVNDINSPEEATKISDKLLSITDKNNLHIVVVLHQNKGNEHARGHLGTELQNKAETVISVSLHPTDKELSIVSAEMTRNKPFEDFGFRIGENGLPHIDQIPFETKKEAFEPESIGDDKLKEILSKIFEKQEKYTATELKDMLRIKLHTGESKNRTILLYCDDMGFIVNTSKSNTRKQFEKGEIDEVF